MANSEKLSKKNLKEFCRICLVSLKSTTSFNIHIVPNLTKLFILLTSFDINEENEAYPKSLCKLCYHKMLDLQELQNLAIKSAEILYGIMKPEDDDFQHALNDTKETTQCNGIKYDVDNEDDDDNQLLLPEIAPLRTLAIKSEPLNIDELEGHATTYLKADTHVALNIVKNEINSEYEESYRTHQDNNDQCSSTAYDSIGEEADDEELALRNGDANASSATLNASPTSNASGRTWLNKRDRTRKSLKCPHCDKHVYKQAYLDAHIRAVHEGHEKPFLCNSCQKAFTRYNQLLTHIQSHHQVEEKHVCGVDGCSAAFKMANTLETHRRIEHSSYTSPFPMGLQKVLELHQTHLNMEKEMDHICPQCYKKYSSKRALTEHLKRHNQIKEHTCRVCGVAKVTRTELLTHMRTHDKNLEKFKCNLCPQEFSHKNAIARHVRVVHEGLRRFQCRFCPKRFGTRNSQVCHERLHTGERPYNCEICNRGFTQLEGLKSHMKNHDKNLRKHVCSYCSQRFITRKNLYDHEARHRGDKPHICSICSRGFYKYEDLQTHKNMHLESSLSEIDRKDEAMDSRSSESNS